MISGDRDRGQKILKSKKFNSQMRTCNLNSHDDFREQGQGTENFKKSKIPFMNKKMLLKLYDESCEQFSEYL